MQRFKVRFTRAAEQVLLRPYDLLLEKALATAGRALGAIEEVTRLRRLGFVALFEIDDNRTVIVLVVRHQRGEDYPTRSTPCTASTQ